MYKTVCLPKDHFNFILFMGSSLDYCPRVVILSQPCKVIMTNFMASILSRNYWHFLQRYSVAPKRRSHLLRLNNCSEPEINILIHGKCAIATPTQLFKFLDLLYVLLLSFDGVKCSLQEWNNPLLTWNASQYGGIDEINVDASQVWVPDIVLYNRYSRVQICHL